MSRRPIAPEPHLARRAVMAGILGAVGGAGGLAACTGAPAPSASTSASTSTASSSSTASITVSTSTGAPAPATSAAASPSAAPSSPSAIATAPAALAVDGPDIQHGPIGQRAVALTFHGAGDVALTRRVLAILADAHAAVTVFAVGQWLAATPALGRDIVAAGHDLGNHTWSHQTMPSLSPSAAAAEVSKGAAAVAASVGAAGLLFRPSGTPASTATIRDAAAKAGYHRCVSYDVDPEDFADPGRDAVVSRTLAAVTDGSIVSLHLGHQGTVDALPAILTGLAGKGLRPVRLTTLLAGAA